MVCPINGDGAHRCNRRNRNGFARSCPNVILIRRNKGQVPSSAPDKVFSQKMKRLWREGEKKLVENKVREGVTMSDNDCSTMELWCLERAKTDPKNRGKWLAEAERWHELTRARNSWRLQKRPFQQSMHVGPMATHPRQQG